MKKNEIKYLFFIPLIYIPLILFHKFMFLNIQTVDLIGSKTGGGAAGLSLLAFSILLSVCLILLFYNTIKVTVLKKSFLLLLLYFFYFSMRVLIDQNIEKLKSYTVATTGGMILFYGMGVLTGLLIRIIYKKNDQKSTSPFCYYKILLFVIYAIYNCYSIINVFISQVGNISSRFFVLKGDVSYQRTGNFLLMNSIILSLLYIENYVSISNLKHNKIIYKLISFFIYLFYMIEVVIFSQLVGSNTAFACSIGILLLLCLFHVLFFIITKKKCFFYQKKFSVSKIFFLGIVRKSILYSILILSVSLVFIVLYLNVDLTKLRFFNYGEGSMVSNSFTTRFELLHNFIIHFSVSPFFGNMAADALTTGDGSYVHSLLLSMLSHVGMFGTVLFLFFISQSLTEFFYISTSSITLFILILYKFLLFFGFFAVACIATFLNWSVLWFLFGALFAPIKVIENSASKFLRVKNEYLY